LHHQSFDPLLTIMGSPLGRMTWTAHDKQGALEKALATEFMLKCFRGGAGACNQLSSAALLLTQRSVRSMLYPNARPVSIT